MKRTPLYDCHIARNAKMVDFFGWEMPLQYTTISQEHNAVRHAAGLFDISHMGQLLVQGPQAKAFLQYLITNDIEKASVGHGIYAHILNENGGVIDDIFVYQVKKEEYLLIVNASRIRADLTWINKQIGQRQLPITEVSPTAGLALQGPNAIVILNKILTTPFDLPRFGIGEYNFEGDRCQVGRTGYTGEDGVELFGTPSEIRKMWDLLFHAGEEFGLEPCGLGARDTLRTEVAYPLYGHELDDTHTPLEAGLNWVVKFDKGPFIGRDALLKQKSAGIQRKLVGIKVESGGVARSDGKVFYNSDEVGTLTSGTFSPSLGISIGLAYLPIDIARDGVPVTILQGTRNLAARTVTLPFYVKASTQTKV